MIDLSAPNWAMQIRIMSECTSFTCRCRSESWVCINNIVLSRVCWPSTLWMISTTSEVNLEFSWLTKSALKQDKLETYEERLSSSYLNRRDCAMRRLDFADSKEALNFAISSFRSTPFTAAHVSATLSNSQSQVPPKIPEAPLSSSQTYEELPLRKIHEPVICCMRLQPVR
jgi:hypothetical protein